MPILYKHVMEGLFHPYALLRSLHLSLRPSVHHIRRHQPQTRQRVVRHTIGRKEVAFQYAHSPPGGVDAARRRRRFLPLSPPSADDTGLDDPHRGRSNSARTGGLPQRGVFFALYVLSKQCCQSHCLQYVLVQVAQRLQADIWDTKTDEEERHYDDDIESV